MGFKWAFKKLPKSIPEALKKDLGWRLDQIFLAEGIDLIIPNFLQPLIFASLYQDKEVRKKCKIYEANSFKESALELSGFYSNHEREKNRHMQQAIH